MVVKTSELIGPALDWAVAKSAGFTPVLDMYAFGGIWAGWWVTGDPRGDYYRLPTYSTDWSQGGPLIAREKITVSQGRDLIASIWVDGGLLPDTDWYRSKQRGPTPLIAAMRCYVASKLGDEVEIPEGL